MGGGDRLKASRAGKRGGGLASNGSKTAPTCNLVQKPTVECRKRYSVPYQNDFYWPVFGK